MIKNNFLPRLFILGFLSIILTYCATPFSPSGGEKDETPPALITKKSTLNKQINFKKQDIILTFNEWINLKDIFEQVVISPPLEHPFELKIKGKSVRFQFDEAEVLKENATYTINFGDAVRDITENNPAQNLQFVFATGEYLDSLSIRGTLIDAITQEPVEKGLFMLYEDLSDSIVYKERPFYFAKSNKDGSFQINNIKSGTFKAVALKDEDLNYLYSKNEFIGFLDTVLLLKGIPPVPIDTSVTNQDSLNLIIKNKNIPTVKIKLFQEDVSLLIGLVDSIRYGYLNIGFNQEPINLSIRTTDPAITIYKEIEKDSLKIWYTAEEENNNNWSLIISRDSILNDTIPLHLNQRAAYREKGSLAALIDPDAKISILPNNAIAIPFNNPLELIDTSKFLLTEDSTHTEVTPKISFDTISGRQLKIHYNWKEEKAYHLSILPGAITDIFGLSNQDSISMEGVAATAKSFGNLALSITELDSTSWYVCELFYKEKDKILTWVIKNKTAYERTWSILKPGDYQIIIKRDDNKNGRWDSGSYDNYRQIEPVYKKKLETLRQNWDLEAEVSPIFN